jgi:hypothetical protein
MKRFVEGQDRAQGTLFPECLEDWIDEDNPVRVWQDARHWDGVGAASSDGAAPPIRRRRR